MNVTTIDWENGVGIAFEALLVEAPSYEADVPSAPTQSGFVAFDCSVKSIVLRIDAMVSDIGLYGDAMPGQVEAVKSRLLMLQANGELLRVTTDGGIWDAMVLKSLSWSRTGDPSTQKLSLTFSRVRLATVSVVAGKPVLGRTKKLADEAKAKKEEAEKSGRKRKSLAAKARDGGVDAIRGWLGMGAE